MPRRIMLSAFVIALSATSGSAADLPAQSRLGAIFADPAEVRSVRPYSDRSTGRTAWIIPYNLLPSPPWNRGGYYYGSPWSYYYPGPYYGGSYDGGQYVWAGARLPYVCGLYGYCN
jgi:hypothetical protein